MKPNCMKCKYYFITFDQHAPKGCKAYNIKSKQLPSMIVKQASGGECLGFSAKPEKKKPKDLNDPRMW